MKKYKATAWWRIDTESFVLVVMWRSDTGIVCELSCGGLILKYPRLPRESPSYIGRGPL